MTYEERLKGYADLLIIQYRNKPKARATIKTLIDSRLGQDIVLNIKQAYNIDTAVGKQLDVLGKYVGARRLQNGQLLSDDDFRLLIKILARKNTMSSSMKDIADLCREFLNNEVLVFDNFNMSLTYYVSEKNPFLQVLVKGDYLPRPQAVGIGIILVVPDTAELFGYVDYLRPDGILNNTGYNDYYGSQDLKSFLDYDWTIE